MACSNITGSVTLLFLSLSCDYSLHKLKINDKLASSQPIKMKLFSQSYHITLTIIVVWLVFAPDITHSLIG